MSFGRSAHSQPGARCSVLDDAPVRTNRRGSDLARPLPMRRIGPGPLEHPCSLDILSRGHEAHSFRTPSPQRLSGGCPPACDRFVNSCTPSATAASPRGMQP